MRLLSLTNEEIVNLLNDYEKDSKAFKKDIFKMCWFMRGGISLTEAWNLAPTDREIIAKIIEENLELTGETKLPFF